MHWKLRGKRFFAIVMFGFPTGACVGPEPRTVNGGAGAAQNRLFYFSLKALEEGRAFSRPFGLVFSVGAIFIMVVAAACAFISGRAFTG